MVPLGGAAPWSCSPAPLRSCTETLLGAHGFTGMQIDGLVEAKLATSSTRAVRAGERLVEVTMVRITDAGRVLLEHGS
jgi:hypothetical protein